MQRPFTGERTISSTNGARTTGYPTCKWITLRYTLLKKNTVLASAAQYWGWNDTEKISMAPAQGWHANSWSVPY